MPWKKGQSGNPAGRVRLPKAIKDIREAAREYSDEALKALVDLLRKKSTPPGPRAIAARELLDRGYGKPTQHVEANVSIFDRLPAAERSALETAIDGILADRASGTSPTTH